MKDTQGGGLNELRVKKFQKEMQDVFYNSQLHLNRHRSTVQHLVRLYEKDASPEKQCFRTCCFRCIEQMLCIQKTNANVDRLMAFVTSVFTLHLEKLLPWVLHKLLGSAEVSDKAIRFRACQLIGKLLHGLGEDAEISTALWDRLTLVMCHRAKDKVVAVRLESIPVLSRLQDPRNAQDVVTEHLIRMLTCDPSKQIRQQVLQSVAVTNLSLASIVSRLRDSHADVRVAFFKLLQNQKIELKVLDIATRMNILRQGLGDRNAAVRESCEDLMMNTWLFLHCEESIVAFLQLLDIEEDEKLGLRIVQTILRRSRDHLVDVTIGRGIVDQLRQEDRVKIPSEAVLVWRMQCFLLKAKTKDVPQLDEELEIIPDVPDYVACVQRYIDTHSDDVFTIQQYLLLGKYCDFTDETGRRLMQHFLQQLLSDGQIHHSLISPAMILLSAVERSEEDYVGLMSDILSECKAGIPSLLSDNEVAEEDSSDRKDEVTEMTSRLNDIETLMDNLELDQELEYQHLQAEALMIEKFLVDPQVSRTIAGLTMIETLLTYTTSWARSCPDLERDWIFPSLACDVPAIRELAVKCLGLVSLEPVADRSSTSTKTTTHVQLLWQIAISPEEEEEFQRVAIQQVFDLVMVFPALLRTLEDAVPQLIRWLEVEEEEKEDSFRLVVVEGSAKLLLHHRIHSRTSRDAMLQTLCALYTASGSSPREIQMLTVFWTSFASSKENQHHILLPVIRTLVMEQLAVLSPVNYMQRIPVWLELIRDAHLSLALDIALELHATSSSASAQRVLCRVLPLLHLPQETSEEAPENVAGPRYNLAGLRYLLDQALEGPVSNAISRRHVSNVIKIVDASCGVSAPTMSDETKTRWQAQVDTRREMKKHQSRHQRKGSKKVHESEEEDSSSEEELEKENQPNQNVRRRPSVARQSKCVAQQKLQVLDASSSDESSDESFDSSDAFE